MKLSFEHISKLYGDTAALQQIDLTLGSGVYGLLGPNGAGKTTLMRIMTDLLAPSTGRVLLDGQDIAVMGAAFRKKLGYLPQDFGVYPNFTAEQFLLYIARLKGLSKFEAKRQTDDLLHMVGLEDKKQKKLKGFSGGQRQRVGIAQALLGDPEILVLDEPNSGLDPRARVEMKELLLNLKSMGKTIVISSHILSELSEMCNSIGIMNRGHLVIAGKIDDVMSQVFGKNQIIITIEGDMEPAVRMLKEHVNVKVESVGEKEIRIFHSLTQMEIAQLIAELIGRGILVTGFHTQEGNLEALFMELTGGAENAIESNC